MNFYLLNFYEFLFIVLYIPVNQVRGKYPKKSVIQEKKAMKDINPWINQ